MTPDLFLQIAVRPALGLLPPKMNSAEAQALILAICLQESRLSYRRQIQGPARSYFQFERGGIAGVLQHDASRVPATDLCFDFDIPPYVEDVYQAIEFHDVLAAGFARCLLWTLPGSLPGPQEPGPAWDVYLEGWRPGAHPRATWLGKHPQTWDAFYAQAWATVLGHSTEGTAKA